MSEPNESEIIPPIPKPRARYTASVGFNTSPVPTPAPRRYRRSKSTSDALEEPEENNFTVDAAQTTSWNLDFLGKTDKQKHQQILNGYCNSEPISSPVILESPPDPRTDLSPGAQDQHDVDVPPGVPQKVLCPDLSASGPMEAEIKCTADSSSDTSSEEEPLLMTASSDSEDKLEQDVDDGTETAPSTDESRRSEPLPHWGNSPSAPCVDSLAAMSEDQQRPPGGETLSETPKTNTGVNMAHAEQRQNMKSETSVSSVLPSQRSEREGSGAQECVSSKGQSRTEQSALESRPKKLKAPRVATIRVSRKKQALVEWQTKGASSNTGVRDSAVSRSNWLDVWKGKRHYVLWVTLDGKLLSLWKKRTDKFTEIVIHVSNITNVQTLEGSRFTVSSQKKHFEFLANNDVVRDGWVSSLHASLGQDPPEPPKQQGPLTMKDPRTKVYAAICGHDLWIFRNKEDFGYGVGITFISMNVAQVKQTGRHGFSLITPYKTFSFSADSSRDLTVWLACLTQVIRNALSCSEIAQRVWASPWNNVCAECGLAKPEWASVNLLVVICDACAGQHRSMGTNVSKVRSLKMDRKVWTEPLIQLFVLYGNKASNEVWGCNVPAAEQILGDASPNERRIYIMAKYIKGRYRRAHPLASSQKLLNQRLCEVVTGPDISETMSLLCSGAQVTCVPADPTCPSPISLAERAGQAMQTELLRHNEFTEAPAFDPKLNEKEQPPSAEPTDHPASKGEEELHGKLEEDRFLFSEQNDSAAYDVLDLREVISIFDCSSGPIHEFEMLTLTDRLQCTADTHQNLMSHMLHIIKVLLPCALPDLELEGVQALSRVSLREGGKLEHKDVWAMLRHDKLLLYPTKGGQGDRVLLTTSMTCNLGSSENTIEVVTADRFLSLQFEQERSCQCWNVLLKMAVCSAEKKQVVYPSACDGNVPTAIERCISHITQHGLTVDGIYRRCGMVPKVARLVEELSKDPHKVQFEPGEIGILETAGALKRCLRQQSALIPESHIPSWVQAAANPVETVRMTAYRRALDQLPADQRALLRALFGHLYQVQLYSHVNRMTAQNLALVFVPTLFQDLAMSTDMVRLTRELIIHYTLIFQGLTGSRHPGTGVVNQVYTRL